VQQPRKRDKYYVVLSSDKNYTQGAFEYSDHGYKKAVEYVRKIEKKTCASYYIKEK
jgi:hypothetical protein|tara:strand:+ start:355 stop:522 length:168 start_codon:yes stop_codon:yes gene_type:complete